jgi:hypothetical protein
LIHAAFALLRSLARGISSSWRARSGGTIGRRRAGMRTRHLWRQASGSGRGNVGPGRRAQRHPAALPTPQWIQPKKGCSWPADFSQVTSVSRAILAGLEWRSKGSNINWLYVGAHRYAPRQEIDLTPLSEFRKLRMFRNLRVML